MVPIRAACSFNLSSMEHNTRMAPSNNVSMKRLAFFALVGCSIAVSHADDAVVAKEWVIAGLNNLRSQSSIYIDLAGTQTVNGDTVNLKTTFLYKKDVDSSGKIYERLECLDYMGSTLAQRIVGDGTNLWSYDPINNTYTVTRYGSYGTLAANANYTRNLLQAFMSAAKGRSVYIARLMLDAKSGTSAIYTPWLPASYAEVTNYSNVTRVRYLDGNPTKKIITYLVAPDGLGGGVMTLLGYWDSTQSGNKLKTTTWLANITTNVAIDPSHFAFSPPAGARGSANAK